MKTKQTKTFEKKLVKAKGNKQEISISFNKEEFEALFAVIQNILYIISCFENAIPSPTGSSVCFSTDGIIDNIHKYSKNYKKISRKLDALLPQKKDKR